MKAEMTFSIKELRRLVLWGGIFNAMSSKWSGADSRLYGRLQKVILLLEDEQREKLEERNDPDRTH